MVTLLIGKKGAGKTKKLIALANEAVAASSGNVVVIEKGAKLTYDVTHKARLIDTEQYNISGYDMLYGFLSGICAGNYDVTDILVDSTFKIAPEAIVYAANAAAENAKKRREQINATVSDDEKSDFKQITITLKTEHAEKKMSCLYQREFP